MSLIKVNPAQRINLKEIDPSDTGDEYDKKSAQNKLIHNIAHLAELQTILYADKKQALLIVFQALDAGGKDGCIRKVMSGVNPQGVQVASFKSPTEEELAHDFLWRVHQVVPAKGMIGVFNRSHYEDVLIARVHNLVPQSVWQGRYQHINHFEQLLTDSGITLLKFYLHISKEEQKKRLQERLDLPEKRWKFDLADLTERALWSDYWAALEDVFAYCSPENAPWYIVPADKKWYRNLLISETIIKTLEAMDLRYPHKGLDNIVIE